MVICQVIDPYDSAGSVLENSQCIKVGLEWNIEQYSTIDYFIVLFSFISKETLLSRQFKFSFESYDSIFVLQGFCGFFERDDMLNFWLKKFCERVVVLFLWNSRNYR